MWRSHTDHPQGNVVNNNASFFDNAEPWIDGLLMHMDHTLSPVADPLCPSSIPLLVDEQFPPTPTVSTSTSASVSSYFVDEHLQMHGRVARPRRLDLPCMHHHHHHQLDFSSGHLEQHRHFQHSPAAPVVSFAVQHSNFYLPPPPPPPAASLLNNAVTPDSETEEEEEVVVPMVQDTPPPPSPPAAQPQRRRQKKISASTSSSSSSSSSSTAAAAAAAAGGFAVLQALEYCDPAAVQVTLKQAKTTNDYFSSVVPEVLFSQPYFWDLRLELGVEELDGDCQLTLLRSDDLCTVVDPAEGAQALKHDRFTLQRGQGQTRFQFLTTSYMHGRVKFCLRLDVTDRQGLVVASLLSSPFLVRAKKNLQDETSVAPHRRVRKAAGTTTTSSSSRKRASSVVVKQEEDQSSDDREIAPPPRKRAAAASRLPTACATKAELQDFVNGLDEENRLALYEMLQQHQQAEMLASRRG